MKKLTFLFFSTTPIRDRQNDNQKGTSTITTRQSELYHRSIDSLGLSLQSVRFIIFNPYDFDSHPSSLMSRTLYYVTVAKHHLYNNYQMGGVSIISGTRKRVHREPFPTLVIKPNMPTPAEVIPRRLAFLL